MTMVVEKYPQQRQLCYHERFLLCFLLMLCFLSSQSFGFIETRTPAVSSARRKSLDSSFSFNRRHSFVSNQLQLKATKNLLVLAATNDPIPSSNESTNRLRIVGWTTSSFLLLWLVWQQRVPILQGISFLKEEWLMTNLDRLNTAGIRGLILYTFLLWIWTMTAGITTPIETAAGMAFGPIKGIIASGIGKAMGAVTGFVLARYMFYEVVQSKVVKGNEFLEAMEESIQETPLRVCLLSRFSPLPEFVKNCGMAVMPVDKRWFYLSVLLHGFSFTCLWTCMGAETAAVLRGCPPSAALKRLLAGATWIGFGAPIGIAAWLKSLKEKQEKNRQERNEKDTKDNHYSSNNTNEDDDKI